MTQAKGLTPILNVSDIQQSFDWFQKIGWEKGFDWGDPPTFGGVCSGKCEIFLASMAREVAEGETMPQPSATEEANPQTRVRGCRSG